MVSKNKLDQLEKKFNVKKQEDQGIDKLEITIVPSRGVTKEEWQTKIEEARQEYEENKEEIDRKYEESKFKRRTSYLRYGADPHQSEKGKDIVFSRPAGDRKNLL